MIGRFLAVFLFAVTIVPVGVLAQTRQGNTDLAQTERASGLQTNGNLIELIGRVINIGLGLLGVVFLCYLLYAGYLWMTAQDAADQIEKAKKHLKNSVIGLLIIVSSFAITNFILKLLAETQNGGAGTVVQGGPGGMGVGFPGNAGSLGQTIEYHVPERDARDIPRNASIIIAFKYPIDPASVIANYNAQNPEQTRDLNTSAIKIYRSGQNMDGGLQSRDVEVRFTEDKKIWVFRPRNLLGNATQNTDYTVKLMPGQNGLQILNEQGERAGSLFGNGVGNIGSGGYEWRFEVSTRIDNTPPKVLSVIPRAGLVAPNIIVQMNFDKPMNPIALQGIVRGGEGFQNIQLTARRQGAEPTVPDGQYLISNQLRTVEFVSTLPCGVNSCGRQIFCLPFQSDVSGIIKAATLSLAPPQAEPRGGRYLYDGAVDWVGNSLDGNGDGTAQGSGEDDFADWRFTTDDRPYLEAPRLTRIDPPIRANNVAHDKLPYGNFNEFLQSMTVTTDSVSLETNEPIELADTFWKTVRLDSVRRDGEVASIGEAAAASRISVQHRLFAPPVTTQDGRLSPEYAPYFRSGVQSLYQNCFVPASQEQRCTGSPYCCDGMPSRTACTLPPPLRPVPIQP